MHDTFKHLTETELHELAQKHDGEVVEIRGADYHCVFRRPTRGEYKRFRGMANNPAQKPDAAEMIARATVVHPSSGDFDKLLERRPGIPEQLGSNDRFATMMGLQGEADSKS